MTIPHHDAHGKDIQIGDEVVLLKKPGGWLAEQHQYALTPQGTYKCVGYEYNCIVTTTDNAGQTATYYPGLVALNAK